jgi:hypothetical protein
MSSSFSEGSTSCNEMVILEVRTELHLGKAVLKLALPFEFTLFEPTSVLVPSVLFSISI